MIDETGGLTEIRIYESKDLDLELELVKEFYHSSFGEKFDHDGKSYHVIEVEVWTSSGKYEHSDVIFQVDSKYYSLHRWRSGSYYTDYTWGYEIESKFIANQVKHVEKTIYVWENV